MKKGAGGLFPLTPFLLLLWIQSRAIALHVRGAAGELLLFLVVGDEVLVEIGQCVAVHL